MFRYVQILSPLQVLLFLRGKKINKSQVNHNQLTMLTQNKNYKKKKNNEMGSTKDFICVIFLVPIIIIR